MSDVNLNHKTTYEIDDTVRNVGSDYKFIGVVVAAFKKKSGAERYVVENADGILHIFSAKNLSLVS